MFHGLTAASREQARQRTPKRLSSTWLMLQRPTAPTGSLSAPFTSRYARHFIFTACRSSHLQEEKRLGFYNTDSVGYLSWSFIEFRFSGHFGKRQLSNNQFNLYIVQFYGYFNMHFSWRWKYLHKKTSLYDVYVLTSNSLIRLFYLDGIRLLICIYYLA